VYEQTDIRSFSQQYQGNGFDIIVGDLSFISLHKIIPEIPRMAHEGTRVILLIKPQFEVGKQFLNRQGIVMNDDAVEEVIAGIQNALHQLQVVVQGMIPSPLLGGDGNREFIISFVFPRS
jgi:23S rRNA (cytidine1920-2'-O)/16S rRNA (cytidine1409-2'-O)-methyltransferase